MVSLLESGREPGVYADRLLNYCLESSYPLPLPSSRRWAATSHRLVAQRLHEPRCDGCSDFPPGTPVFDEHRERERVAKTNEPGMSRRRVSRTELGGSGFPGDVLAGDGSRSTGSISDDPTHPFPERRRDRRVECS